MCDCLRKELPLKKAGIEFVIRNYPWVKSDLIESIAGAWMDNSHPTLNSLLIIIDLVHRSINCRDQFVILPYAIYTEDGARETPQVMEDYHDDGMSLGMYSGNMHKVNKILDDTLGVQIVSCGCCAHHLVGSKWLPAYFDDQKKYKDWQSLTTSAQFDQKIRHITSREGAELGGHKYYKFWTSEMYNAWKRLEAARLESLAKLCPNGCHFDREVLLTA